MLKTEHLREAGADHASMVDGQAVALYSNCIAEVRVRGRPVSALRITPPAAGARDRLPARPVRLGNVDTQETQQPELTSPRAVSHTRSVGRPPATQFKPEMARAMTSCWISDVPSKIVWVIPVRPARHGMGRDVRFRVRGVRAGAAGPAGLGIKVGMIFETIFEVGAGALGQGV